MREQVEIRSPNPTPTPDPNQVEIRSMPEFDRNLKFIMDQVRTGAHTPCSLAPPQPKPDLSPTLAPP